MAEVNEAKREKSQVEDINRSLYDFRYEEKDAYKVDAGLTPAIVEQFPRQNTGSLEIHCRHSHFHICGGYADGSLLLPPHLFPNSPSYASCLHTSFPVSHPLLCRRCK